MPIYKKHQRDTAASVNSNIFKCSFLNQKWKLSGVLFILTVLWKKSVPLEDIALEYLNCSLSIHEYPSQVFYTIFRM